MVDLIVQVGPEQVRVEDVALEEAAETYVYSATTEYVRLYWETAPRPTVRELMDGLIEAYKEEYEDHGVGDW